MHCVPHRVSGRIYSAIAFWAYRTLIAKIGAARAGYVLMPQDHF